MDSHRLVRLIVVPILLCGGATGVADSESAARPAIRWNAARGSVDVIGLGATDLAKLTLARLDQDQWQTVFAVYVAGEDQRTDRPAVLGAYRVEENIVRFEPRFPLTPGLSYRAVFHPNKIPGSSGTSTEPLAARIVLAKPMKDPTTVEQVYPSGDQLPENQLRFYIHFSGPMRQGEAFQHIHLLNSAGKPMDHPFLELDEELWDPQGKRFTLLFHPGRIKKGLKPREELGPILEAGKRYTLVIDQEWSDADGNPLKRSVRKSFQAGAALEQSPDPKTWKLSPPIAGTRDPLAVRFRGPLDQALLERMVWVTDLQGHKVAGIATVTDHETRWQFTPQRAWQPGTYHVVADTRLEDPAGNSIRRPFEVDVFHPIEHHVPVETVQLPFSIPASPPR